MSETRLPSPVDQRVRGAIALIATVPGYMDVAEDLERRRRAGQIRFVTQMQDRGVAGLNGTITLGPEPFAPDATLLGLAETLVHEAFHLKQNPLQKTASFWTGVFTFSPVMRRYERPAYAAALEFLLSAAAAFREMETEALKEAAAVRASYAASYGEELEPSEVA